MHSQRKNLKNLSWFRRWKQQIAYVTVFALLFQSSSVLWAQALSDADITADLDLNAAFERAYNSAIEQYRGAPYLADQSNIADIESMDGLRSELLENYPSRLGEPEWERQDNGSGTTNRLVYPSYEHVGSDFVNNRYVRMQVQDLLNRHLIDGSLPGYSSERLQIQTLYSNAYQFSVNNSWVLFGERLEAFARDDAPVNMVWPEVRTINGEEVLVPVVYLTAATVADRRVEDQTVELNGNGEFESIHIQDVDIKLGRNSFLTAAEDITCNGCTVENSGGELGILAGGNLNVLSGVFSANGDLTVGAKNVDAQTLAYRYDTSTGHGTRYGQITGFNSDTGDIEVRSYGDITLNGTHLDAGGSITLGADGGIYVGAQPVATASAGYYRGDYFERSSIEYLISKLSAEESIQLIANSNIVIDAAEIASDEGHIELLAGMGIIVEDELAEYRRYDDGQYGSTDYERSAYQTVAIRSLLDAGKGVRLKSAFGDITLKATDIRSTQGTEVKADGGAVNLLMTTETDHYSYTSVYDGLFVTKTSSHGHYIETGVPNSIVGGFAVEAAKGLAVEYEGDPDLTLDEQVNKLAQMDGLGWMADVRDQTSADDWHAINLKYQQWSESNTSLSPAFGAVVAIAVAIATQGAAAGFASGLTSAIGGGAVVEAAILAGTQALIGKVALAAANGSLNGNLGEAMENLASDQLLKSLAISMVTAGALNALDTEFFNHIDANGIDNSILFDAKHKLNLAGQATQAVTHATVQTGVDVLIQGGSLSDDFGDLLSQTLINQGTNLIGRHMANEIKFAFDSPGADTYDTAMKYIFHAGAGCILGASKAKADDTTDGSSGCASGLTGAVTGELIADATKSQPEVEEDIGKLQQFFFDHGLDDLDNLTEDQAQQLLNLDLSRTANELYELMQDGIDLARFGGAVAVFAGGGGAGSVDIGAFTAENAAENNGLFTVTAALLLILKATDLALTGHEWYTIYTLYNSGDSDDREEAVNRLEGMLGERALQTVLTKVLPGATTFEKLLSGLRNNNIVSADDATKFRKTVLGDNDKGLKLDEPVKPSASGNICKSKTCGKAEDLDGAAEPSKAQKIKEADEEFRRLKENGELTTAKRNELNKTKGDYNEELSELVLQRLGVKSLGNSKVGGGSNNGADFVGTMQDGNGGEFVVIAEAKQFKDGVAKLSNTSNGVQLSGDWIDRYVLKLRERGDTEALSIVEKVEEARVYGKLKTVVTGYDKSIDKLKVVNVELVD